LNFEYDIAQPGGRTPLDGINASNKTVAGYQSCQLVNRKQTEMSRAVSVLPGKLMTGISGVPKGGGFQPPEIPKALQNHAKLNPIVKTVKNC